MLRARGKTVQWTLCPKETERGLPLSGARALALNVSPTWFARPTPIKCWFCYPHRPLPSHAHGLVPLLSGENFGKYLKVGVVEDEDMKDELAKLCRFFSKNHGEDFVSFDEYIKDMKVGRWCMF